MAIIFAFALVTKKCCEYEGKVSNIRTNANMPVIRVHPYTRLHTHTYTEMGKHDSTANKDTLAGGGDEMGAGESPSPLPVQVD